MALSFIYSIWRHHLLEARPPCISLSPSLSLSLTGVHFIKCLSYQSLMHGQITVLGCVCVEKEGAEETCCKTRHFLDIFRHFFRIIRISIRFFNGSFGMIFRHFFFLAIQLQDFWSFLNESLLQDFRHFFLPSYSVTRQGSARQKKNSGD
jgi:hypothetical protein